MQEAENRRMRSMRLAGEAAQEYHNLRVEAGKVASEIVGIAKCINVGTEYP
jgi:hypothetical protein